MRDLQRRLLFRLCYIQIDPAIKLKHYHRHHHRHHLGLWILACHLNPLRLRRHRRHHLSALSPFPRWNLSPRHERLALRHLHHRHRRHHRHRLSLRRLIDHWPRFHLYRPRHPFD